ATPHATTPTTPPIESELPPPPPMPPGERMEWSLRGDTTTGQTDPLFAPPRDSTPATAPGVMLGTDNGTATAISGNVCPTCGSAAKIDLIDRHRGLQHLSCVSCYRVWQSWLER
ncbi:MAG: hypothetical protein OES57_11825, partial [Acidimicrobiia bacterium]|nr:hypothetical protein [Acidimicrobiia bacterium]